MKESGGSEWENEHKTELSLKSERGREKGNGANPLLESTGTAWVDLLGGGRGAWSCLERTRDGSLCNNNICKQPRALTQHKGTDTCSRNSSKP